MFKRIALLLVALTVVSSSLFSQDNYLAGSTPYPGDTNVPISTTVKFQFNNELHTPENLENLLTSITPIPFDKIEVTAFRLSGNKKTIELDVKHQPNTDYYWILNNVLFADGSRLSFTMVPHYTTRSVLNPTSVSGFVEIQNSSIELFSKKMSALTETNHPVVDKSKLNKIFAKASTQSGYEYEIAKAFVILTDRILDDEMEDDYSSIRAAGYVNHEGRYTISNVKSGAYYVYGIYADEEAFAFGFYDANQDGTPDMISVMYESLDFIDFTLEAFPGFEFDGITSEEVFPEAHEIAVDVHADARLILVEGSEFVLAPVLSDSRVNKGRAFFWTYVYYSPQNDAAFVVIAAKNFTAMFEVDKTLYGTPISEIAPIENYQMKSDIVAHYAYAYAGSIFIDALPEYAELNVNYQMSRITGKYPEVSMSPNTTYWEIEYQATFTDQYGNEYFRELTILIDAYSGVLLHTSIPTSIENPFEELPVNAELSQNYPNPFNPSTSISFSLPSANQVTLIIYDMVGKEVARLADGFYPAGTHNMSWNAANMASGVYLYRLQAGDQVLVRKMTLMK